MPPLFLCYTAAKVNVVGRFLKGGSSPPLNPPFYAKEVLMPAESTFDIVSEFDRQELVNAVDQTQRDVRTRYDLKDSKTELTLGQKDLTITADAEIHVTAVRD